MVHRITPACAGKSDPTEDDDAATKDHPRVCGEKMMWMKDICKPPGSPPRVRGKGKPALAVVCHDRITPACAGKRLIGIAAALIYRDHPRVCGEKPLPPLALAHR